MIYFTQLRLREWGKFNREAQGGYPSVCPYLSITIRGHDPIQLPADVELLNAAICRASPQNRAMLRNYYCRLGSKRDKALAMGVSDRTYRRMLSRAEWEIHSLLDAVPHYIDNPTKMAFAVT